MSARSYAHLLRRQQSYCLSVAALAAAPRRALTVSQWADEHRELTGKQAGERGRYRTSRTPWWREVMDCFSATSRVTDVVLMCDAQSGKTESLINILGYSMDHCPRPIMVMMPTDKAMDDWKVQKFNPLLTDTDVIKALMRGNSSRDSANSKDRIDFPGGILFFAGANSPNSYAGKSVAIIILDDYARFPDEVGEEGDPGTLAKKRTKSFPRGKRAYFSTPTNKTNPHYMKWEESDQRHYHVPCPHCGDYQQLEWGGPDVGYGLKWNKDLTEAWYVCRHNGCIIRENDKPALFAEGTGRWIATNPKAKIRGYQKSALYANIGLGDSWLSLAQEWVSVQKNRGQLKAFINTQLAEGYEEDVDGVDSVSLLSRLEEYPDILPRCARAIGTDVQKDRIELTVADFGVQEELWTQTHIILAGDVSQGAVWDELEREILDLAPDAVAIDAGYQASMVQAFCDRPRMRGFCFAVVGRDGPARPLVEDHKTRKARALRKRKGGFTPYIVGDEQAKALVLSRLKLPTPGPGYIHFPLAPEFDDEYFAQLTAEVVEQVERGTRTYYVWKKLRPRNEALDTMKLCLAALRLSGKKTDVLPAPPAPALKPSTPALLQKKPGFSATSW